MKQVATTRYSESTIFGKKQKLAEKIIMNLGLSERFSKVANAGQQLTQAFARIEAKREGMAKAHHKKPQTDGSI